MSALHHLRQPVPYSLVCCLWLPQEVAEKEAIAAELAAAETRLLATHRGPLLLKRCAAAAPDAAAWEPDLGALRKCRVCAALHRSFAFQPSPLPLPRCHVDAYKKGGQGWQQRAAAADVARREFEELFGASGEAEAQDEADGGRSTEEQQAAVVVAAERQAEAAQGGRQQDKPKKKKQPKKKGAAAGADQQEVTQVRSKKAVAEAPGQQGANDIKTKKRKKARASVQAQADEAPPASQPIKKKKKKSKE